MKKAIILIFLDGFGLGEASEKNPLYTVGFPSLEKTLGTKLISGASVESDTVFIRGIDAVLGVQGIPQSATGQTSLLTGVNAQEALGFHLPAFPDNKLVTIIENHSILKKIHEAGLRGTFANAYTKEYFNTKQKAYSVTTHCVKAAGIPFRMISDLMENNAVYWDISRSSLASRTGIDYEVIEPYEAGVHLVNITNDHDFVLFECFEPDLVGHATDCEAARLLVEKLDAFLSGVIEKKSDATSLLICSDHGNIEDCTKSSHTDNPVPLIAVGPIASVVKDVFRIDQVTPAILRYLTTVS